MLVLRRPVAVREVHVAQPVAEGVGHVEQVAAGGRRVRQVERDVPVVVLGGVPPGQVGEDLAAAGAPGVHVLDGEVDAGALLELADAVDERPRVLALPAERRVHHHGAGAHGLRDLARALELGQGSVPHTRWVSSSVGAWMATTGRPCCCESALRASGLWLTGSVQTMISMPS
ncbi:hypothetical protein GCM10025868_30430 [Angustibacter aerolatus]|uniref:Uncharacterized protein n=1 Tax=Angustibacter aerolatus TaxID=1162965 RepID=A0ABQ6JHV8_9ACTN|nr:hypothetical protein GCM10025868_30430 [Angustibacter aerolatus]